MDIRPIRIRSRPKDISLKNRKTTTEHFSFVRENKLKNAKVFFIGPLLIRESVSTYKVSFS